MQAFDSFRFVEKDSRGERDGEKGKMHVPFLFPFSYPREHSSTFDEFFRFQS